MTKFFIDNKPATPRDYKRLTESLEGAGFHIKPLAEDGQLTQADLKTVFVNTETEWDKNEAQNRHLCLGNVQYFGEISKLLKKYGLDFKNYLDPRFLRRYPCNTVEELPAEILVDPRYALPIVKTQGYLLHAFPASIRDNREVVLAAVQNLGSALQYASDRLKADIEIVVSAYEKDSISARVYCDSSLTQRDILDEMIIRRGAPIDDLERLFPNGWKKLIARLEAKGLVFPGGRNVHNYKTFVQGLSDIGFTKFPRRFKSVEDVARLWTNRQILESGQKIGKPIALLMYNVSDWNGVFQLADDTSVFVNADGFFTIYYETKDDEGMLNVLEKVSSEGTHDIHTVVLAGHGTRDTLQFGESGTFENILFPFFPGGDHSLDLGDLKGKFKERLANYLKGTRQLFLHACSNGEGGESADNLSNAMAHILPSGAHVFSTQTPNNVWKIHISENLELAIRWREEGGAYNPTAGYQKSDGENTWTDAVMGILSALVYLKDPQALLNHF
ncbi:MAG: DUF4116 domain-containing protein [Deltaproteobacteria bacterium]|nr:DUF4116 domain-containing protein [Deltaproteobacteria bacterium]